MGFPRFRLLYFSKLLAEFPLDSSYDFKLGLLRMQKAEVSRCLHFLSYLFRKLPELYEET